jgi:hypothetical protein
MAVEITQALEWDLKDYYLLNNVLGWDDAAERVRRSGEVDELPVPRLVIIAGEPKRYSGMDGTARIPVRFEFATSKDRGTLEQHVAQASLLEGWLRELRSKRGAEIAGFTRCFLHDVLISFSVTADKEREAITALKADMVITQCA